MKKALFAIALVTALSGVDPAAQRRIRAGGPLRVVLIVDSSVAVGPMINSFRQGLRGFLEDLPGDPEIALVTTGGGLRIRAEPSSDRSAVKNAAEHFSADGGANALLRTLLETDERLLRTTDRRPILVILATDMQPVVERRRLASYQEFLVDFVNRGGRAHAVIVRGSNPQGIVTELADNLTSNTGGFFETVLTDTTVPQLMRTIALYVAADE